MEAGKCIYPLAVWIATPHMTTGLVRAGDVPPTGLALIDDHPRDAACGSCSYSNQVVDT